MKIRILHNTNRFRMAGDGETPVEPNDTFEEAIAYTDLVAKTPVEACERAFRVFNIDPAELTEYHQRFVARAYRVKGKRSLSVGDIVEVDAHAYACGNVGFVKVEPPIEIVEIKEAI